MPGGGMGMPGGGPGMPGGGPGMPVDRTSGVRQGAGLHKAYSNTK